MTTLTELSNEELLLHIVKAERDSCGFTGSHVESRCWCPEADCCCHSLSFKEVHGKVPILAPELMRLPCPDLEKRVGLCAMCHKAYWEEQHHSPECTICMGRGWIPNPDPWAMKQALLQGGYSYSEEGHMPGQIWVAITEVETQELWFSCHPETKRAFLLATADALGQSK